MSFPEMRRVQLVLDVQVSIEPERPETSGGELAQAQRRLLEVVLADEELTAFFCRHAAAVPLIDWLQGEPVAGLEWLGDEPRMMKEAICRLAPEAQALFRPAPEGRLDGELDRFYAAFRPSYCAVQVIPGS